MADFSGVSHGAKIYSASDDYSGAALTNPTVPREYLNLDVAPVFLGRHAIIGAGSVVLPGAILSEGTAVGAMTLIKHGFKTADWSVYFGSPARKIADRAKALLEMEAALLEAERQAP
jgi:galactoside O-acetyltransferase